jgi:uncharacterized membrane protein YidH (DUF202 family)
MPLVSLFNLGELLTTVGELIIAYAVIRVHHRILKEKKIDQQVIRSIGTEQILVFLSMILISVGFILRIL